MMKSADNVFITDVYYTIEYAVAKDGKMPAKEGLEQLRKSDYRRYSRFKVMFIQLAKKGHLPSSKLDDFKGTKLKKFKHSQAYPYRIPCFFVGNNRIVLTHVFKKKGSKYNKSQIDKANRIMKEHLGH